MVPKLHDLRDREKTGVRIFSNPRKTCSHAKLLLAIAKTSRNPSGVALLAGKHSRFGRLMNGERGIDQHATAD
jgi:hypothetical protein